MESAKKTILLVEDDQSIRELYAVAFIKAGFDISMAEDGLQGVAFALQKKPDLILLDIDLPRMNGFEVAATLRQDEWGKSVPIIFLTNRDNPLDEAHASLEMPQRYIIKANTSVEKVVAEAKAVCTM